MQPIQKINIRLHNNHACKDLYKFFGRFDMKVSKIQENKKFPYIAGIGPNIKSN